ncbi:MAG: (2Fe-2S)-binding protein [Candidatus Izimaplasma sp.]|nr:(2Fe-2S)-binding protein [Candidatus Izimaplasma bacterium]
MAKKNELCSCFKITKKDVKDHIKAGITSYKELQKQTDIGTKCSSCKKKTKKKFKKYRNKLGAN